MLRIKCPHCGAGNQDTTEQDTCWQCGNVLGAPVVRPEPTPNSSAYTPSTQSGGGQARPVQMETRPAEEMQAATDRSAENPSERRFAVALAVVVLVIVLLVALVILLLLSGRK
jgi:hypothetical protein